MSVSAGRRGSWGDSRHQTAPGPLAARPPGSAGVSRDTFEAGLAGSPQHCRVPLCSDPELEGPQGCVFSKSAPGLPAAERFVAKPEERVSYLPGATHLRAGQHRAWFMSRSAL